MAGEPPREAPPGRRGLRLSRNARIGIGLLLSFAGIGFLAVLVPVDPASLPGGLALVAGGMVALWTGGILLGRAHGP